MHTNKNAILIINTGTPDAATKRAVRKFLYEFLNDPRVIDLPLLVQKILVNLIIIPLRTRKSTNKYKKIFTPEGSPLLVTSQKLLNKLQHLSDKHTDVFLAMRYGNPSLKHSLQKIQKGKYSTLTVLPMFPQYASATSGSVIEAVLNEIKTQNTIPNIHIINQFYNNKHYIETFTKKIKTYSPEDYDHILFSYHGLPKRQINKCHPEIKQAQCNCAQMFPKHGDFCYQAICFETSRLLAQKMELAHNSYSTSFQSHMSKNWTGPFTSDILIQRAQNGDKNILVIAPSFVTDCLETTLEIGEEYAELFQKNGGKKLTLVNSLNDDDNWAKTILEIINNEYRTP